MKGRKRREEAVGGGGVDGWDEDEALDDADAGMSILGTLVYEEEGEAKTTKAYKNLLKNPGEQVCRAWLLACGTASCAPYTVLANASIILQCF